MSPKPAADRLYQPLEPKPQALTPRITAKPHQKGAKKQNLTIDHVVKNIAFIR